MLFPCYREVGNVRMARSKFNQSLAIDKDHVMSLQLRGDLLYHTGEPDMALRDFNVNILTMNLFYLLDGFT